MDPDDEVDDEGDDEGANGDVGGGAPPPGTRRGSRNATGAMGRRGCRPPRRRGVGGCTSGGRLGTGARLPSPARRGRLGQRRRRRRRRRRGIGGVLAGIGGVAGILLVLVLFFTRRRRSTRKRRRASPRRSSRSGRSSRAFAASGRRPDDRSRPRGWVRGIWAAASDPSRRRPVPSTGRRWPNPARCGPPRTTTTTTTTTVDAEAARGESRASAVDGFERRGAREAPRGGCRVAQASRDDGERAERPALGALSSQSPIGS